MTTAWPAVAVGDVAEFIRGVTFKPDQVVSPGSAESIACFRTSNVQSDLDLDDVWAVPRTVMRRPEQQLQEGDTLISSANSWNLVGKCCWVGQLPWPATFGGFVTAMRVHSPAVDPRYLFRWFSSGRVQATVRSFGRKTTSISNLNLDLCRQMAMPLPPIAEQRRIASILDQAEALRAKRNESLSMLNSLAEAIFLGMFGDPIRNEKRWRCGPWENEIEDVRYGTGSPPSYVDEGVPFLRATNVKGGTIVTKDLKFISARDADSLAKCTVRANDLIIVRSGVNTGDCALVPDKYDGACAAFDMIVRLPRPSAVFYNFLINSRFGRQLVAPLTRRAAQPHLNASQLRNLLLIAPPLDLRREFADRLCTIDRERHSAFASLDHLDRLFAALQHRAFARQL